MALTNYQYNVSACAQASEPREPATPDAEGANSTRCKPFSKKALSAGSEANPPVGRRPAPVRRPRPRRWPFGCRRTKRCPRAALAQPPHHLASCACTPLPEKLCTTSLPTQCLPPIAPPALARAGHWLLGTRSAARTRRAHLPSALPPSSSPRTPLARTPKDQKAHEEHGSTLTRTSVPYTTSSALPPRHHGAGMKWRPSSATPPQWHG